MQETDLKPILTELAKGNRLSALALDAFFQAILDAKATPAQIGAFLTGLERLGLGADELLAGAKAMRSNMIALDTGFPTLDVCGTGGDGSHSLNISTAVSFVIAGIGHKVAKHGNRSMSSKCGAADVLEALGVKLVNDPQIHLRALEGANLSFFFAPNHHPKLAYVGPIRRELGFGTIFNMLGPLCNPTRATSQLMGIYRPNMTKIVAQTLRELGSQRAWVVYGEGGIDEIVMHGETKVAALENGDIREFAISPGDAGLPFYDKTALVGGDVSFNARALMELLEGAKSPYRDAVLLNTSAALVMAGFADDLKIGAEIAAASIDTESALNSLKALRKITNGNLS